MLAWPSGALIGLGALAFFALMAEGAMGDRSSGLTMPEHLADEIEVLKGAPAAIVIFARVIPR